MSSVCIDGFNLALSHGTGIATYGRNLLTNLKAVGLGAEILYGPEAPLGDNQTVNEALAADIRRPPQKLNRKGRSVRMRRTLTTRFGRQARQIGPSGDVIWPGLGEGQRPADRLWAASSLFTLANRSMKLYGAPTPVRFAKTPDVPGPDVMHWTAPLPLHAKGMPNVYTFHDLIPLRLPYVTTDEKQTFMALCREVARRADHICVVSETTRRDVERILNVHPDRITNTYQAVSIPSEFTSRNDAEVQVELERTFNLPWKDYFLHFGAIEPKKNLGRIVQAYLASGSTKPLVLIGREAWLHEGETAVLRQVERDGGSARELIRQYDYMPQSLLLTLIRGARATLFPSLYEGFGLPVLESMALSTAVLTSTAGSLPEVAGDAAVLVDPYDIPAMTRAIRALAADDDLCGDLVERGRAQAARFTSEAYQDRLTTLYAKVGVSP